MLDWTYKDLTSCSLFSIIGVPVPRYLTKTLYNVYFIEDKLTCRKDF